MRPESKPRFAGRTRSDPFQLLGVESSGGEESPTRVRPSQVTPSQTRSRSSPNSATRQREIDAPLLLVRSMAVGEGTAVGDTRMGDAMAVGTGDAVAGSGGAAVGDA